jgi:hypothetical protein
MWPLTGQSVSARTGTNLLWDTARRRPSVSQCLPGRGRPDRRRSNRVRSIPQRRRRVDPLIPRWASAGDPASRGGMRVPPRRNDSHDFPVLADAPYLPAGSFWSAWRAPPSPRLRAAQRRAGKASPGVQPLDTVPGLDPRTAEAVVAHRLVAGRPGDGSPSGPNSPPPAVTRLGRRVWASMPASPAPPGRSGRSLALAGGRPGTGWSP